MNTISIPNKGNTKFIAHRGLSAIETENTAAAFLTAANRSYYGIETDIWRTADHKYICHHDGQTGRLCTEKRPIEDSTLEELQRIILMDIDQNPGRQDHHLCTPQDYLRICSRYEKNCLPELKSQFTIDKISEIVSLFQHYLDHTSFISFQMENLIMIKKLLPKQSCQFLTDHYEDSLPEQLGLKNIGIDIIASQLTQKRVELFHEAGVTVNCWIVDDPETAKELISWGVDYITTDILE